MGIVHFRQTLLTSPDWPSQRERARKKKPKDYLIWRGRPGQPSPEVSPTLCPSQAPHQPPSQSWWKTSRRATGRNGRKNLGYETVGLVTSLLTPRGSLTGKLHHACVDTGLAEGRMHRFEADGNLHKRPFRNCPLQTPQPAFRLLAVHIRVPHGNTRAFRAFLVREGRETMVYFWASSTYRRRLEMMAASFGCGTGLLAAFFFFFFFSLFLPLR